MAKLVGILNITPDSFSDGGLNYDLDFKKAKEVVCALARDGADVIDIGAESTRPGASPLEPEQEWERLQPILENLKKFFEPSDHVPLISVDTRHAEVAKKAISLGVDWINDVSGFSDPKMQRVACDSTVRLVVMHSLSVPVDREQVLPLNADPVEVVLKWGDRRFRELEQNGVTRERLIFDPGIGFGKTAEQSLALLRGVRKFKELGVPVMIGHSRKSFLSKFTNKPFSERDPETVALSLWLADQGIDYLRVHNVGLHARAFKVARALIPNSLAEDEPII